MNKNQNDPIDKNSVDVAKHQTTEAQTNSDENNSSVDPTAGNIIKLFLVLAVLAALTTGFGKPSESAIVEGTFAIAIHGGAGGRRSLVDEEANVVRETAIKEALEKGQSILAEGGTALDAVEQVIMLLENDPNFNAGKGAVFNAAGGHELDASIMDGQSKSCGAVAGVKTVKNPIGLARLVMTETRHVLLSSDGAETFAEEQDVEQVSNDYFSTPRSKARWELYNERLKSKKVGRLNNQSIDTQSNIVQAKLALMGTVGCVALDTHGNLAAGTSTGGMTNKKYGRVGDSPVVGAGTYADNGTCAVSGTGIGEQYIRNAVAYDVSAQMKYKQSSLQEAIDDNLNNRLEENDGGLIAVDREGNIATGTNTAGMIRGVANSDGLFEVSW